MEVELASKTSSDIMIFFWLPSHLPFGRWEEVVPMLVVLVLTALTGFFKGWQAGHQFLSRHCARLSALAAVQRPGQQPEYFPAFGCWHFLAPFVEKDIPGTMRGALHFDVTTCPTLVLRVILKPCHVSAFFLACFLSAAKERDPS